MPRVVYPAIVERGSDGFGAFFPDLPGCVAHGATAQEAALAAEEVLAAFVSMADEHGDKLANPSELDAIGVDLDVQEVARILVPADMKGRSVRVQITLDEGLLAAIDKAAANRSGFIAEAVRAELRRRAG